VVFLISVVLSTTTSIGDEHDCACEFLDETHYLVAVSKTVQFYTCAGKKAFPDTIRNNAKIQHRKEQESIAARDIADEADSYPYFMFILSSGWSVPCSPRALTNPGRVVADSGKRTCPPGRSTELDDSNDHTYFGLRCSLVELS